VANISWKDVGATVANVAPLLGTILGGPAGAAIGGVVAAALGAANEPQAVLQAVQSNPDAAVKLRAIELDHDAHIKDLAFQTMKAQLDASTAADSTDAADRASARQRQVAVRDLTTPTLAWIIVGATLATACAVVLGFVSPGTLKDPTSASLIGTTLGYLISEAKQVVAYYFGSSKGSDRKTELLAQSTPVPPA
jgi:hypothetical protein